MRGMRITICVFVVAAIVDSLWSVPMPGTDQAHCSLAVLADPADPYYPLGVEIARSGRADLVPNITQAYALQPDYLVWVVSPAHLSDRALVDYGRSVQHRNPLALGFISGSTIERARELWMRRPRRGALRLVVAEGAMASGPELPGLRIMGGAQPRTEVLNRETFVRGIQDADYVFYEGHGDAGHLRFDQHELLIGNDIPPLPPLVLSAFSCNTFRLWQWQGSSIALAFVDRGAAAYAGFSYSPMPGCTMDGGFPFSGTWPEFPIGRVVQLQARAAMLATSRFPIFYMLGDPRIALRDRPSYEITSDREQNGARQIDFAPIPPSAVPIRIDGGARYEVAEVPGFSRASMKDSFYSGRLQMLDVGSEKYLLVQHPGGPLTIRLMNKEAITTRAARTLLKALDLGLAVDVGGDRIAPMLIGAIEAFGIWLVFRKRGSVRTLVVSLVVGIIFFCAQFTYAALRMGRADVISSTLAWKWWQPALTLVSVAFGSMLFLNARRLWTKTVAVAMAAFMIFVPAVFWLAGPFVLNFMIQGRIGAPLYNYSRGTLYLLAAGVFGSVFVVMCLIARRFSSCTPVSR